MAKSIQQIDAETYRNEYLEKPLPSSETAEKVVLGSILIDPNLMADAVELIEPSDFYSPTHRRIFKAMVWLFEKGDSINPIFISERLKTEGLLESIGGVTTITNLTYGLPFTKNIADPIKIICDYADIRNFIRQSNENISDALAGEYEDTQTFLVEAEQKIADTRRDQTDDDSEQFSNLLENSLKRVRERLKTGKPSGLTTGFRDLDNMTGGFEKGHLNYLLARPSIGKTSLALSMAEKITEDEPDVVIAFFSLETSKDSLADRMIVTRSRIDSQRYKNGYMQRSEWGKVADAVNFLSSRNIELRTKAKTVIDMRAAVNKIIREKGRCDLIIIDFLQIMQRVAKIVDRREQVSHDARALQSWTQESDIPILCLSQLSRKPETRPDNRPKVSDGEESGAIEQTANKMIFLFREEYYFPDSEDESIKGVAEAMVLKNKDGATGTVKLAFLKEFMRFENYFGD